MHSFGIFLFLALSTCNSLALQWIFNPKLAKNMSIQSHGDMLSSKLSWSEKSQNLTVLKSDTGGFDAENDRQTRSGGGRGLKFPNISDVKETSVPKATRISKQFSLVPFSDLINSRTETPSRESCKFGYSGELIIMQMR